MPDFGSLPPEINSARMYAGPGSAPMMAAAAAWDALASQLDSAARGYTAVISNLYGEDWLGNASDTMVAAVAPYLAWTTTTGATAEEAANRARTAAAAYEQAFAATVPPPLVAANRVQLANLVASDFLGQNTAAIASTEAAYDEMWAQDAAAMYGYAASSAAATRLTPFSDPTQTTNPAGQSAQSAAVAQALASSGAQQAQNTVSQTMAAVPQQLQSLSTGASQTAATTAADPWTSLLSSFSAFNTLMGPVSLEAAFSRTYTSAASMFYAAKRDIETHSAAPKASSPEAAGPLKSAEPAPTATRPPVAANMGGSAPVGRLSVPQSWAPPAAPGLLGNEPLWVPESNLGATATAEAAGNPGMLGAAPAAGMGAVAGAAGRSSVSSVLRVGPRKFSMPRPAFGG